MDKRFNTEKMRGFLLEVHYGDEKSLYVLKDLQGNLIKTSELLVDCTEFIIHEDSLKELYKRRYNEQIEFQKFLKDDKM